MKSCSCWRNKQYEEIIEDVKVREGDAQAEWNCLWVSFFVGCIGRNKCCKRGCFVINLVKIELNDKIENVDG